MPTLTRPDQIINDLLLKYTCTLTWLSVNPIRDAVQFFREICYLESVQDRRGRLEGGLTALWWKLKLKIAFSSSYKTTIKMDSKPNAVCFIVNRLIYFTITMGHPEPFTFNTHIHVSLKPMWYLALQFSCCCSWSRDSHSPARSVPVHGINMSSVLWQYEWSLSISLTLNFGVIHCWGESMN